MDAKVVQIVVDADGRVRNRLEDVRDVAMGALLQVDEPVLERLAERRAQVVNYIKNTEQPAYGFNRGFGGNVDIAVPKERLADLQTNLIRSHASGLGDPAPTEVVRAAMFLRLVSLAQGHSGVRPEIVKTLADMLNKQITPVVPCYGSVGASGDLAPLSHIALGMLGEGEVFFGATPERLPAAQAFERAGLTPIVLEMKEGLALNNGVQFSTAYATLAYFKLMTLLKTAAIATATTTQVMLGADTPFRRDLHELRPHAGATQVAGWIWALMQESPIRRAHQPYDIDGEVQDPYNIRCAAQILGACYDLLADARRTLEVEITSVTDNPVIVASAEAPSEYTDIVSGGHFHGMPIAIRIYGMLEAMGIMARLSNMRCVRFVDSDRNKGVPRDLKWPELTPDENSVCSGMMIPEYASAALTNVIWGACMPTHLFSLSTDGGQEDHVSMSAGLAVRLWDTLPRLADVLAIELAFATQAAAIRKQMDHMPSKTHLTPQQHKETETARGAYHEAIRQALGDGPFDIRLDLKLEYHWKEHQRELSPACRKVVERVRQEFPTVVMDRYMSPQLQQLADLALKGAFVALAEQTVPLSEGGPVAVA